MPRKVARRDYPWICREAIIPPSTNRVSPFTYCPRSEDKYRTAFAISLGNPPLPAGTKSLKSSGLCGGPSIALSSMEGSLLEMAPGAMQLAVIFFPAKSAAIPFTLLLQAIFAVPYAVQFGIATYE